VVLKSFAGQFEAALQQHLRPGVPRPLLALDLIALQLAAGQLASRSISIPVLVRAAGQGALAFDAVVVSRQP